jgi:cytochrome c-type biogenesis protein
MSPFFLGAFSALWLGILTSISPCPLATNIAAISFLGKRIDSSRHVFLSGLFYTLGRMITYLALGILAVAGLLSIPGLSHFLQKYMNRLLGPLLILVGMILLELIQLNVSGSIAGERVRKRAGKGDIWGAGLLGITFSLSFCPVSAALFFGSLIPLSVKHESHIVLPSLYGLGTGLPVVFFAVLMAMGARFVGKAFQGITRIERWVRYITGGIFIVVGIYYSLTYIFGVL